MLMRTSIVLRILIPAVMFGLIVGISFIEAPLKFQAPGITIPLGLGIGRLVFQALNATTIVLLVVLTMASIVPRVRRRDWGVLLGIWAVLLTQVLVIRPPLNARTDQVLAGVDTGGSLWHYLYIACEVVMLVLLAIAAITPVRALVTRAIARDESPSA